MRILFSFLIGFCCFIFTQTIAQNQVLDSLASRVRAYYADSTFATLLYEKATYYVDQKNEDSFRVYAGKLYDFASDKSDPGIFADYYYLSVSRYVKRQKFDSALADGRLGYQWSMQSNDMLKIALACNALGNANIYTANGDSAVIYLLKGLPYAQKTSNDRLKINLLYNLSAAYNIVENFPAAKLHAKRAYEEAVRISNEHQMFFSLFNWATMEARLENLDTALTMFNKLAAISRKDNDDYNLMDVLNNLGDIYYRKGNFKTSLEQYNEIARILKEYDEPEYDLYLYMNRGNTLIALGRYDEASSDLEKATTLATELQGNHELSNIYFFRSSLAEKTRNFHEALTFWKVADSIKQSIVKDESRKHLQQLEVKYQTSQKDLSISQQQFELSKKESAIKKKNAQNIGLLVGCTLLALILFLAYRNIRQRNRISKNEKALHDKELSDLERKHQLVAMQSILRGQEQERGRMAKDLHDGIGGLLSGVKLGLSAMTEKNMTGQERADATDTIVKQLDRSISELRRVSHNMMPEALMKFGLKEALENYCENLNLSGKIHIRLQTYGLEHRMKEDEEISIYRIVQELLNNIIKHADAQNVLIQLTREEKTFSLTVEDDGKGFNAAERSAFNSAGLMNISSRAEFLKGSVDIQSAPGEGTSVTVIGECCHQTSTA